MIVVDASALLEGLLRVSPAGDVVEKRIFEADQTVHVPHLLDLEVTQVLRRRALHGLMTVPRCRQALDDLTNLTLYRYPNDFLLRRVWELRVTSRWRSISARRCSRGIAGLQMHRGMPHGSI